MPVQSEASRVDRLRSAILAAARCADLDAMHDAIVAYHQLLGIEEGEPDKVSLEATGHHRTDAAAERQLPSR